MNHVKKKNPLRRWMYFEDGWKTKGNIQVVIGLKAHLQWTSLFVWDTRYHTRPETAAAADLSHELVE